MQGKPQYLVDIQDKQLVEKGFANYIPIARCPASLKSSAAYKRKSIMVRYSLTQPKEEYRNEFHHYSYDLRVCSDYPCSLFFLFGFSQVESIPKPA